jgi:NADH-quinone oxidoreductase subunit N
MSVGTKLAAFVALARIFPLAFGALIAQWQGVLIALAIVTMLGGNLYAATQTNVKRMLAYSSIAHAGYALIGIAIGTRLGLAATLLYLACYATMNTGAFGALIALERAAGLGTDLADCRGLGQRRPFVAAVLAVCLFALAGIPGTAGFVAKFAVFAAAFQAGHAELTIVGVIASMAGFYFYLRVIWAMYFEAAAEAPDKAASETPEPAALVVESGGVGTLAARKIAAPAALSFSATLGLALALIGTLALGILPGPLTDLARYAAGLLK